MRHWIFHKGQEAVFQWRSSLNCRAQGLANDKTAKRSRQAHPALGRGGRGGFAVRGGRVSDNSCFLPEPSNCTIQNQASAPFSLTQNA